MELVKLSPVCPYKLSLDVAELCEALIGRATGARSVKSTLTSMELVAIRLDPEAQDYNIIHLHNTRSTNLIIRRWLGKRMRMEKSCLFVCLIR